MSVPRQYLNFYVEFNAAHTGMDIYCSSEDTSRRSGVTQFQGISFQDAFHFFATGKRRILGCQVSKILANYPIERGSPVLPRLNSIRFMNSKHNVLKSGRNLCLRRNQPNCVGLVSPPPETPESTIGPWGLIDEVGQLHAHLKAKEALFLRYCFGP